MTNPEPTELKPSVLAIVGALLARLLGHREGLALDVAGLGALTVGGFTWNTPLGCAVLGVALLVLNARHQTPGGPAT